MDYSRRDFGKLALTSLPAATLLLNADWALAGTKPDSKWAGVQVGMNVPYNFGTGNYTSGDDILQRCVQLNISYVELRAQPVELFLGSPAAVAGAAAEAAGGGRGGRAAAPAGAAPNAGAAAGATGAAPAAGAAGRAGGGRGGGAAAAPGGEGADQAPAARGRRGGGRAALTAGAAGRADRRRPRRRASGAWASRWTRSRSSGRSTKMPACTIDIVKWDGIFEFSDDELDYAFEVSKALGRPGALERDHHRQDEASRAVRRQAQDAGRLSRPRRRRRTRSGRPRSPRPSTTARTSTSATSSPATTRRLCRSSRSTRIASRTCTSRIGS